MARISKEEQARVRQKILDVASRKFNQSGYEHVSTKDIAREVGIAEGTLFNYFESKTMLFLEVFGEQFMDHDLFQMSSIDRTKDIVDVMYDHLHKLIKMMVRLPKRILSELVIASVKMSRKRPERFRKFVELDFKYIEQTKILLDDLYERGILQKVSTDELSQTLYSVVLFEFVMYLYDESITKETMLKQIKSKMDIILRPYIIGGNHGN